MSNNQDKNEDTYKDTNTSFSKAIVTAALLLGAFTLLGSLLIAFTHQNYLKLLIKQSFMTMTFWLIALGQLILNSGRMPLLFTLLIRMDNLLEQFSPALHRMDTMEKLNS